MLMGCGDARAGSLTVTDDLLRHFVYLFFSYLVLSCLYYYIDL